MTIAKTAKIGKNVTIKNGVIIEDNVIIGDNCHIDYNTIIREHVTVDANSFIGANCILGEFLPDAFSAAGKSEAAETCTLISNKVHPLLIGRHALIRSGSILYGDSVIGDHFTSGHRVTIRENTKLGHHVSLGTLSDVQGDLCIGNYVHIHSNVFIGSKAVIKDYVWVFPNVIFTNDPTPPSNVLLGITVEEFASVCAGSILLPGVHIGKDALVGAGTNVTKDVPERAVVVGNPGKIIGDISDIRDRDGNNVYPWRHTFRRGTPWSESTYEEWLQSLR